MPRLFGALAWWAGLLLATMPARAQSMIETPGPLGPLRGTMLPGVPAGGPVVLIIPGSGPTDREGNSPLGVQASTYRLLAEGLAGHGITSVRIDKRGLFGSSAAVHDANAVTIADYATDVRSWVATIREKTREPCVWLLGHSEGSLVALVAAQSMPEICGLLLVASPGRPLAKVLRAQLEANPANAPLLKEALAAIESLEAGRRVDTSTMPAPLQPLFAAPVQDYLISVFALDPVELLRGYRRPALILQGLNDLQIDPLDARLLASGNPDARLVLLPNINHVLKFVGSSDRAANLVTYADPDLPLGPGVIDSIVRFLSTEASGAR